MKTTTSFFGFFSFFLMIAFHAAAQNPDTLLAKRINEKWVHYRDFTRGNSCCWKSNKPFINEYNQFVSQIINQYGFPGILEVGDAASENFCNILSQPLIETKVLKDALSAMKIKALKKDVDVNTYARLYDQMYYKEHGKQLYGTIVNITCADCKPEEKKFVVMPVESPEKVDERRKAIGLDSLSKYVDKLKAIFVYTPSSDVKVGP